MATFVAIYFINCRKNFMIQLTETTIQEILGKVNVAMRSIADEYGLDYNLIEPKFSEAYFEAKLTLRVNDNVDLQEKERKEYYMQHCESIYLSPDHWGKEFVFPPLNNPCVIYGLDFHDNDNPILIKDLKTNLIYKTAPIFFFNSI